jgi:hypothetical protein
MFKLGLELACALSLCRGCDVLPPTSHGMLKGARFSKPRFKFMLTEFNAKKALQKKGHSNVLHVLTCSCCFTLEFC